MTKAGQVVVAAALQPWFYAWLDVYLRRINAGRYAGIPCGTHEKFARFMAQCAVRIGPAR